MLKINLKNKVIFTTFLEIIFTILLILLLVFIRQKAIYYLDDVQNLADDVSVLEQDLSAQNLTSYDRQELQSNLDKMESLLDKGMFLIKFVLPISLFLLSLAFYFIIWRITSKVGIFRFIYSVILHLALFLIFVYLLLNYISYVFYFVLESPIILLIASLVLLVISYYFSLILLSNNKSLKANFKFGIKNLKSLALPYLLILITDIIYFSLVFWVFFLTYIKENIIYYAIALFAVILIINFQRIHLFIKISKL